MAPKAPYILLGAGGGIVPNSSPEEMASLLKHIQTLPVPIYGIDTAGVYPMPDPGLSERVLGKAGIGETPLILDTKILVGQTVDSSNGGALSKVNLQKSMDKSLEQLKVKKVRVIYAHQPDTQTSVAEAVEGFGKILKDGKAESWGVSNFSAAQVEEYAAEAKKQGVPLPTLYQGQYNAIFRSPEEDLFPVLKKHGIKFYAYSPTAGGFLSTKVAASDGAELPSRFQAGHRAADRMNAKYNKPKTRAALVSLHKVAEAQGIDLLGASLRWLAYHSPLGEGDGIILGASKVEQIDHSDGEIAKGPLPEDIVAEYEKLWAVAKGEEGS
ncbi:aldehyde reductase [Microthyrium microscopicum]|uniref:Aldehyde reductase n=1 Tax=Microthyrium microscopicum TaxID=703497 RepID=A0A6A6UMF1_9PEZI|nr:aldehyde reductase [Microthyrium microscopicum]